MSPKFTAAEDAKLVEAVCVLRMSPAFPIVEARLKARLAECTQSLIFNQTALVPNLQGRAQELTEIIELLNRKPK